MHERRELPENWASDFDLFDPAYVEDPYSDWVQMRAQCPVARSERYGGAVLPVRHEDIAQIAHDPATFSSRVLEATGPVPSPGRELKMPPITSDPPDHDEQRRLLLPLFTKPRIRALEGIARRRAAELIDAFGDRTVVDAADEFARHIPVTVIARMLGVPVQDEATFDRWVVMMLKEGPKEQAVRREAIRAITAYFSQLIAVQRESGQEDGGIVQALLTKRDTGPTLTDDDIVGMCLLVLVAGIDTTWSAIGSCLWHLATHPVDRRRLVDDPALLDTAIEELLRAYAPITIGRTATCPTSVGGVQMAAGDRVLLPFAAANRDPNAFDRADEVLIDREENRHLTFGLGIHRCIGSNLARMELKVALTEWLRRVPEFELAGERDVTWTGANVRGPEVLHLRFAAAALDGGDR
ncbi:cytochrome P450 [Geodermatophilus sabuli]|uniref:Cytochrome P450 n=1 Tax=Geodermatophilus sabuli TaxID=1564158 RepID=A0A7K3VXM6_9ACTN|nr:cytochrome P450 [Geodermatophilus sabuli]NEK56843.1 cytochrome P450 [Geodermatophilus sabuli]